MPIANVKYTAGKTTQTRRLRYEDCEEQLLEGQLKRIIGQEHKVDPRTVTIHSVEGASAPKPFGLVEQKSEPSQIAPPAAPEAIQTEPPAGSQAEGAAKSPEPPKADSKKAAK